MTKKMKRTTIISSLLKRLASIERRGDGPYDFRNALRRILKAMGEGAFEPKAVTGLEDVDVVSDEEAHCAVQNESCVLAFMRVGLLP